MQLLLRGYRYRKGTTGPFESVSAMEWCHHCHMEVDVRVEQGSWSNVDVFRKVCERCDRVTHWGVDRRALASNVWGVMKAVASWIFATRKH